MARHNAAIMTTLLVVLGAKYVGTPSAASPGECANTGPSAKRLPGLGKPTSSDVGSGVVTGLFSIPEGSYGVRGHRRVQPGRGPLRRRCPPRVVGSLTSRTVLMVTTLTSSLALISQSVLVMRTRPKAPSLASGLFQSLLSGGSLSRTGVAVSAGARTRWEGPSGLWSTVAGRI